MGTVMDLTIPSDQFVLRETVKEVPGVKFEMVRLAVQESESLVPFLWAGTSKTEHVQSELTDDPAVKNVSCTADGENCSLYGVTWSREGRSIINELVDTAASVVEVVGTSDKWSLQVIFPNREAASDTYRSWCNEGFTPSLHRIRNLSAQEGDVIGLSPTQHRAIAEAYKSDYYDVPRGMTLEELATNFEVSHQALSERLRRGHSNLVEQMLSESTTVIAQQTL